MKFYGLIYKVFENKQPDIQEALNLIFLILLVSEILRKRESYGIIVIWSRGLLENRYYFSLNDRFNFASKAGIYISTKRPSVMHN